MDNEEEGGMRGTAAAAADMDSPSPSTAPSTPPVTDRLEETTPVTRSNVTYVTLTPQSSSSDMQETRLDLSLEETDVEESGTDNPAFEPEEVTDKSTTKRLSDSALNGTTTAASEKQHEAVNLELVHMGYANGGTVPGIPVKKEVEAEAGSPYDEYFVPVNEHRKYMRGEKLYVTKDKRSKPGWTRCCSWVTGLSVVAALVIIAILAATGVINMSQDDNLVQVASIGRGFGGSSVVNQLPTESPKSSVTPPPTSERNSQFSPTTDQSYMFVPRALEGSLRIDNVEFVDMLNDPNTRVYRKMKADLEMWLKDSMFTEEQLKYGAANISVIVVDLKPGSVIATYRVGWNFLPGIRNPPDPIKYEDMIGKLQENLRLSNGEIDGEYHVDHESLTVNHVMDECQLDMKSCPGACSFHYDIMMSHCDCPAGLVWNREWKKCMSHQSAAEEPKPVPEPEPSAEPEPHHHNETVNKLETTPIPEPEPEAEPEPHAEPKAEPEPTAAPEPEPKSEPAPEPVAEPEPTAIPEPSAEPEPKPEPEPTAEPEPKAEPEPTAEPEPKAEPEPTAEPEPKVEPEPTAAPEPSAEPEPKAEPAPDPTAEPEPNAEPEPTTESATKAKSESVIALEPPARPEPVSEPEPTAEPVPNAEPSPIVLSEHDTTTHDPNAEPTTMQSLEKIAEMKASSEPSAEPVPTEEPSREPSPNSAHNAHLEVETSTETKTETTPVPEPTNPSTEGDQKVKAEEPLPEPAAEPVPETTVASLLLETSTPSKLAMLVSGEGVKDTTTEEISTSAAILGSKENAPETTLLPEVETTTKASQTTPATINTKSSEEPELKEATTLATPTVEEVTVKETAEGITVLPGAEELKEQSPVSEESVTSPGAEQHFSVTEKPADVTTTEKYQEPNKARLEAYDKKLYKVGGLEETVTRLATQRPSTSSTTHFYGYENESEQFNSLSHGDDDDLLRAKYKAYDSTSSPLPNVSINEFDGDFALKEHTTDREIVISEPNLDKRLQQADRIHELLPREDPQISESDEKSSKYKKKKEFKKKVKDGKNVDLDNEEEEEKKDVEVLVPETTMIPQEMATNPLAEQVPMEMTSVPLSVRMMESSEANTTTKTDITETPEITTITPVASTEKEGIISLAGKWLGSQLSSVTQAFQKQPQPTPEVTTELLVETTTALTVNSDLPTPTPTPVAKEAPSEARNGDSESTTLPTLSSSSVADNVQNVTVETQPPPSTESAVMSSPSSSTATEVAATEMPSSATEPVATSSAVSQTFGNESVSSTTEDISGFFSKCASGQFQCRNGTSGRGSACVPLSSKCDSINDCSDGSDEEGCRELGCPGNFQCADGICLQRHSVCNGISDCSDGSDEKNCDADGWKCNEDEFRCPTGRCIPAIWQCDGKPDCSDHADENCPQSCGNDEFMCPEGWCIPLTYRCDGRSDCRAGEDENLCDCSVDQFKCGSGGVCISKNQVCDGVDHCPDRSDEWMCYRVENGTNQLSVKSRSEEFFPVCADNWSQPKSDEVCRSMGYGYATTLPAIQATEQQSLQLSSPVAPVLNALTVGATCQSAQFVQLHCQEFTCGSRNMASSDEMGRGEGRTLGATSALAGQLPSVALIFNIKSSQSCTASIITPRWLVASRSCLLRNKNANLPEWKIWAGKSHFETSEEGFNVSAIVPYPQARYNGFLYDDDVALVEVAGALDFSAAEHTVGAVCLPSSQMGQSHLCVTAGWNIKSGADGTLNHTMEYLPVPITDLETCNSSKHYAGLIGKDKICAGFTDSSKALCSNDEGAPLMCMPPGEAGWELHGILSYHSSCGRGSRPSLFSDISAVKSWIAKTTGTDFGNVLTSAVV